MDIDPSFDYMPHSDQLKMQDASLRLQREFVGVYDVQTINRFLRTSYDEFADDAQSDVYAATFAERFAQARLRAMQALETRNDRDVPIILVISEHDSSRAQMAVGFLRNLAGENAIVWSGGRHPDAVLSQDVVRCMAEVGIDVSEAHPKRWNNEIIRSADVIVNIGDHDAVPVFPGRKYFDWGIEDPGPDAALNRKVRDEIRAECEALIAELTIGSNSQGR